MVRTVARQSARQLLRRIPPVAIVGVLTLVMFDQARAANLGEIQRLRRESAPASQPILALPAAVPYADCAGATPLSRSDIYVDTCLPRPYLVAHNPGPFTPILSLQVGSLVSYAGHVYTITSAYTTTPAAQWQAAQEHPAALTLQTCADDSGSLVRVLTAS